MARRKVEDYDVHPEEDIQEPFEEKIETKRELEARKLKEQIKSLELKNKILEKELNDRPSVIKKSKGGPKEKYNILFHPKLAELFYSQGGIDTDFAIFIGVTEKTIHNWKKKHPEFKESIKLGKLDPDSKIVSALYQSALDGSNTAQIFWLKNRRSKDWREKHDLEITGKDGGPIMTKKERSGRIEELLKKKGKKK